MLTIQTRVKNDLKIKPNAQTLAALNEADGKVYNNVEALSTLWK